MNNSEKLAKIDELLADLPAFSCKPGCADCCGPVQLSRLEYHRCVKASGRTSEEVKKKMQSNLKRGNYRCPLLDTKTNRCSVYAVRPVVCRLFGIVKDEPLLRCPHGYSPDSSVMLTPEQSRAILNMVNELGA